jgi:hypothetical protein
MEVMVEIDDQGTIRSEADAPTEPIYVTDLAQDRNDFEPVNNPKKPIKWIVFFIALLLLILGATLIIRSVMSFSKGSADPTPTPIMFISPVPSPTPSPEIQVDKKQYKVKVFNGTGIVGEAKYLKDKLTGIGFETVDTGNAPTTDYEAAQLYVKTTVPQALTDDILNNLKSWFSDAKLSTKAPSGQYDIEIITGFRPGVARPTPKSTPKPTTADSISTPTIVPTNTNTPTPTP